MSKKDLSALLWLLFTIAGYILIFVFYDWKLFVIFLCLGISTNNMVSWLRCLMKDIKTTEVKDER